MRNNIVETVQRSVVRRLREDAEQDRLFRQQALDVYKKLVEYLKSGGELKDFGRAVTIDQFTNLEQGAKYPLKIKWAPELKNKNTTATYISTQKQPLIKLFVLSKDIYDSVDEARREMRQKLENYAKVFIHEYIHYLDDRRTELDLDSVRRYDDAGSEMSVYFSDPVEVNAYFQSGLAQLEHTLEVPGLLDRRMKKDWNENFQGFKNWFFDEHIPPQMQYNISDDQEKRLVNRLYGFWKQIT